MQNNSVSDNIACYGCGACAAACPHGALSVTLNAEGFYEPQINAALCVDCGLCRQVCPKYKINYPKKEVQFSTLPIYAAWSTKEQTRGLSCSGALAAELAAWAICCGYKPAGVIYDAETGLAKTVIANTAQEAQQFRGSKYIQSYSAEVFDIIAKSKDKFMFFGTPCQAAGLRLLARQKRFEDRLIIVDFFYHGVMGKTVCDACLKDICAKHNIANPGEVKFRTKKYGWSQYTMQITAAGRSVDIEADKNPFYALFFSNLALGKACYGCLPKKSFDFADIRMGDFWGAEFKNSAKGVSAAIPVSQRGHKLLLDLQRNKDIELYPQHHEICIKYQAAFKDTPLNSVVRENIAKLAQNGAGAKALVKEYLKTLSPKQRFIFRLKTILPLTLKTKLRTLRGGLKK